MVHQDFTGSSIRTARQLAGLTQGHLAHLTMMSKRNVARIEAFNDAPVSCFGPTLLTLQQVFELNGVTFDADGTPRKVERAA